jgi:hypothetical protein
MRVLVSRKTEHCAATFNTDHSVGADHTMRISTEAFPKDIEVAVAWGAFS